MAADDIYGAPHDIRPSGDPPTVVFAIAVAVMVLALYASQPLVGVIAPALGLAAGLSGLATTLTLLGYASGLFLLVPLTDIVENRRLILVTLVADIAALSALALATTPMLFLLSSFLTGMATSAIQMLVPVAAALSPEAQRGRTVGNVMGGLMLGILVSRPLASLVTQWLGWRALYGMLAIAVAALAIVLARVIPNLRPNGGGSYVRLLQSLGTIVRAEPILRRRAAGQAMCMATFSLFWTAVALRLTQAPFSLGQTGIGLFALAGAAGAIVAPIAGRAGDRGWTRSATIMARIVVIMAMLLAGFAGGSRDLPGSLALAMLVGAAVLLDLGVIADQTLGRRAINLLRPEARGRMNGLFTGLFFLGGAAGSAVSGLVWTAWGWSGVCTVGAAFAVAALTIPTAGGARATDR